MELKFNGNIIEVYSSIEELPITRFQTYNRYALIDSGIGSDINSFDQRITTVRRLMKTDAAKAHIELTNLQQNVRFIMSKTNPKMYSFVPLIKKINGRSVTDEDLTEEGIDKIVTELGQKGLTFTKMVNTIKILKKKLMPNWKYFFQRLWRIRRQKNTIQV